ncbi:hypothetical protein GBA65_14975 [Rubrobacter marinus]|uniref:Uncharacterized protein n=1 Tax=Rubrobacter marinus TaxID=2653852 RepID=A0A6G8PZK2_9ACTN|nr:hypothetical protein [Rubrobacter marinus]QIN79610.1 hypothetical protein GBA65_14975 [Rubrobacter marinus]
MDAQKADLLAEKLVAMRGIATIEKSRGYTSAPDTYRIEHRVTVPLGGVVDDATRRRYETVAEEMGLSLAYSGDGQHGVKAIFSGA